MQGFGTKSLKSIFRNKKKLLLGTAQFKANYGKSHFNKLDSKDIHEILKFAYENKITELDTAPDYGDSELQIGLANTKHLITSKIPTCSDISVKYSDWIEASIGQTLINTKRQSIETILFHNVREFIENYSNEVDEKIMKIKADGLIKKIGVSIYDTSELEEILEIFIPDVIQFPLNPFDQRFIKNYIKDMHFLGIQTIARSIFLQGVLVSQKLKDQDYFLKWQNDLSEWKNFCQSQNLKPYEACIQFILDVDFLDGYTLGVGSLKELQEITYAIRKLDTTGKLNLYEDFQKNDPNLIDPRRWP